MSKGENVSRHQIILLGCGNLFFPSLLSITYYRKHMVFADSEAKEKVDKCKSDAKIICS
jgi:hypothetical protein